MGDHDTGEPDLGDDVLYRSKTGNYDLAAKVTSTKKSLWIGGVQAGHVPDLDTDYHVHLHVFTPGNQIQYQEFNVPIDPTGKTPRSWRYF